MISMGNIAIPWSSTGDGNGKYQVLARVDDGATVTATRGTITKEFRVQNGISVISGLSDGVWTIQETLGGYHKRKNVEISGDNQRQIIYLHLNFVPEFESHGLAYKIVNDQDAALNEFAGTTGDWKIRFETLLNGAYGTIKFNDLHGQLVDIFLVGGGGNATYSVAGWGGSGGGGGYTLTARNVSLEENVEYRIVIGGPCGESSFKSSTGATKTINLIAAGGKSGDQHAGIGGSDGLYGGDGGCGGGGGHGRNNSSGPAGKSGNGASDGGDGTKGADGWFYSKYDQRSYSITSYGGKGQKSQKGPNGETGTTREFGEPNGTLYSSGGCGGSKYSGYDGTPGDGIRTANSGAGGSANRPGHSKENGFSGIVIIRNARG